jgi:hypothetical protein
VKVEGVLFGPVSGKLSSCGVLVTLQIPQATVHSSLVAEAWLAWHSMPLVTLVKIITVEVEILTQIHDVVSADSTVIHNYIPCPQSNGIPLIQPSARS